MVKLNFEEIRRQKEEECTKAYLELIRNFSEQYRPNGLFEVQRGRGGGVDRTVLKVYFNQGRTSNFFGLYEYWCAEGLRREDMTVFSPLNGVIITELCLDAQERKDSWQKIIDEERKGRIAPRFSICHSGDSVSNEYFAGLTVYLGSKKETSSLGMDIAAELIQKL